MSEPAPDPLPPGRGDQPFTGVARLFGAEALPKLAAAHVCIFGLGGVGSWAVEALARSGVGELTLIDADHVGPTNINRQLPALETTLGRPKVDVLAERVVAINPRCRVHPRVAFFADPTADALLGAARFDHVVDAIDTLASKCLLIARCCTAGLPVVTCGGAGGRRDPTQVRTDDLARAVLDPLLKYVRKKLRQDFGFPRDEKAAFGVPAVYSNERPVYLRADGTVGPKPKRGHRAAVEAEPRPGTAAFVTGAFGLAAASVVVCAIVAGGAKPTPRRD